MSLATLISDAVGIWRHRACGEAKQESGFPDISQAAPDTRRLIRDRRCCRVLAGGQESSFDEVSLACAWQALQYEMAFVPGGEVCLMSDTVAATPNGLEVFDRAADLIAVESFYLDRHCVTNADYAKFVQSGGYDETNFWPEAVLPNVLQFVDSSGHPGPKFWAGGNPPADKRNHPVVGICWYEANAYATWAGKRLPSSEEWQRSGTWPKGHAGDAAEPRYPWGNAFDPGKANIWAHGQGQTVAVDQFDTGRTPNGVRQLIGNVWEWVDAQFYPAAEQGVSIMMDQTMAEIRGGAFDTYFHSQATCQFRTGQPLLFRGSNVGFRCCISTNAVSAPPQSQASPETPPEQEPS
ncbi:MAG: formylglycine-generating enzyme family protein [Pirellulales bacterium]|nr:formylglycine-generating enzyme family protein [Pirellulales bacterium]